jgi:hypothetical protein
VDPQAFLTGEVIFDIRDSSTGQPAQVHGCKSKWTTKGETADLRPGDRLAHDQDMKCLVEPGMQVRVIAVTTGRRRIESDSEAPVLPEGIRSNAITLSMGRK